jgi:hypothetical protein
MTRPIYQIRIQPLRDRDVGIRGLRAILKSLLRRHGFKALSAVEIPASPQDSLPGASGK